MNGMAKRSWTRTKINEKPESFIAEARELEIRILENIVKLLK